MISSSVRNRTFPEALVIFEACTEASVHFIWSCSVPFPKFPRSSTSALATASEEEASRMDFTRSE